MKKILLGAVLVSGVVTGSCLGSDRVFEPQPILNMKQIYSYAEMTSNGTITQTNILDCITKTKTFFLEEKMPPEIEILESDWKNAKLVYVLTNIKNCFGSDLAIAPRCFEIIGEICNKKNSMWARYLLMSQCSKWDEEHNSYTLLQNKDLSIISLSINMLQSATNGDAMAAKKLLDSLKESGAFAYKLGKK